MDDVYRLCDMLHEKMDPRRNAFRQKTNEKDLKEWFRKRRKVDDVEDTYEQRRIRDVLSKYKSKDGNN